MSKSIARRFGEARDKLIVQDHITAEEFGKLRDMLRPGRKVRNFVSGNTATVRATCTIPDKPFGNEGTPYLPVSRQITTRRRAGKVEETHWSLLNVDVVA